MEASREAGVEVRVAVHPLDLARCVEAYPEVVMAQNADVPGYGAYTGHVPLEMLADMGVRATLVNHSEYKLGPEAVRDVVARASDVGVETVVCVDSVEEMRRLVGLGVKPTAYAIEPPELIGTGRAVSRYKPDTVVEAVGVGREQGVPVLCGAGVVTDEDVRAAIELGTVGVLVASGVVKAEDPLKAMIAMAKAMAGARK